jgi:chromosomal replication initiator protein
VIAALQDGSIERWRTRYRGLDGLILDDVHELAGKERTQEELFHLFNALHARGKQIVLTANRRPGALLDIEERLRSRFEGGLVVELLAPAAQSTGELARSAATPPRAQPSIDWVKDSVLLDEEKMVWDWPEASDRVIEELA